MAFVLRTPLFHCWEYNRFREQLLIFQQKTQSKLYELTNGANKCNTDTFMDQIYTQTLHNTLHCSTVNRYTNILNDMTLEPPTCLLTNMPTSIEPRSTILSLLSSTSSPIQCLNQTDGEGTLVDHQCLWFQVNSNGIQGASQDGGID